MRYAFTRAKVKILKLLCVCCFPQQKGIFAPYLHPRDILHTALESETPAQAFP
jgi:hypothetical protein